MKKKETNQKGNINLEKITNLNVLALSKPHKNSLKEKLKSRDVLNVTMSIEIEAMLNFYQNHRICGWRTLSAFTKEYK